MHPLARRRATGYLLDCAGYLGVGAAMLPAGLLVARRTDLGASPVYAHLVSATLPAVATVSVARAESGARRATWGKRRRGVQVAVRAGAAAGAGAPAGTGTTTAVPLSFPRALLRNTVKIFLPWQLAHTTAIGAAFGGFDDRDPVTYTSTVLTYGTIALFAVTGLRGSGRGPHDLVAGTVVELSAPARPLRSR